MYRTFYFDRKINHIKGILNPLGLPKTNKLEIHPPVFYPNLTYT